MAGSREHLPAAVFCMKSETKSLAKTEWEGRQLGVREGDRSSPGREARAGERGGDPLAGSGVRQCW